MKTRKRRKGGKRIYIEKELDEYNINDYRNIFFVGWERKDLQYAAAVISSMPITFLNGPYIAELHSSMY